MSIEERLKLLITQRYGNLKNFSDSIGMAQSTLVTILKRGLKASSITNVISICDALNISTDEIINDRIVEKKPDNPQEIDLSCLIKHLREQRDQEEFYVDDKPITKDDYFVILDGIELSIEMIRRNRERKFLENNKGDIF